MKKSVNELLTELNGLVEKYGAMEAETTFASGDIVTYGDGKTGMIESFDQDGNYAVREMDENMEATDIVETLTADEMTKGNKPEGNPEDKPEDEKSMDEEDEDILEEEEEQEYKSGDLVTFTSADGVTYGRIVDSNDNGYTVEVYAPTNDGYEPTGVEVTHKGAYLKSADSITVKDNPRKILAKFNDVKMDMVDENVGIIEGYASTFGNVDLGGDRVMKGAFNQTLMHKNTRKVFFDHFYGVPDVAGVGTFSVDEKGLYMKAELPLDATDVKNAFIKIKFLLSKGEDMGLSIGYNTVKSRMTAEGIRDLLELAMMETSITPFPMNTEALIMSAKSRKIGYQAKKNAWQTIVRKSKTDAPDGNQLNEGDYKSLIEELKTIIKTQ
jgi:HK97 family phage prohead protease